MQHSEFRTSILEEIKAIRFSLNLIEERVLQVQESESIVIPSAPIFVEAQTVVEEHTIFQEPMKAQLDKTQGKYQAEEYAIQHFSPKTSNQSRKVRRKKVMTTFGRILH